MNSESQLPPYVAGPVRRALLEWIALARDGARCITEIEGSEDWAAEALRFIEAVTQLDLGRLSYSELLEHLNDAVLLLERVTVIGAALDELRSHSDRLAALERRVFRLLPPDGPGLVIGASSER